VVAMGLGAWHILSRPDQVAGLPPSDARSLAPVPMAALPLRTLSYSLTVQKYRAGRPYREPFRLPGEMLFGPDDRVRLELSSAQDGHLYVINEGPAPRGGSASFNVLYPRAGDEGTTSAQLAAGGVISIPEGSWFAFDEEQGTERLWLTWSAEPVPPLEAVKSLANPRDRGAVRDAVQAAALEEFFRTRGAAAPEIVRDEQARRTVIRGDGPVLVALLKLEHH
ncbi:MAG TPA: hypothetical protein VMR21_00485, partial [Vicinamibacteria bacterium]|nr:hypothetical protein [Vicinamibacteria bacterium]